MNMTRTNSTGLKYLSDRQLEQLYDRVNHEMLRVHGWLAAARSERQRRAKR